MIRLRFSLAILLVLLGASVCRGQAIITPVGGVATIDIGLCGQGGAAGTACAFKLTLTANTTIAFNNTFNGVQASLFVNPGTFTLTWPSSVPTPPTLTASTNNLVTLRYDGTTGTWQANIGGGGGGNNVGPVINVTSSGASPSLADNASAFSSAVTAAMAAAKTTVGTPTVRNTYFTPMQTTTQSTETAAVSFTAGDTVFVSVIYSNSGPPTFSVSDGVNAYFQLSISSTGPSNEGVYLFSTAVGGAKATSGTMTVSCVTNCPAFYGFIVLDAFNVGSIGQKNIPNTATSTTPSNPSTVIQDNNNMLVSFLTYCGGGATTLSANTGTLQASWNGTAIICGGGAVTNTAASAGTSVTTSATISASEPWTVNTVELRSVSTSIPTIYFPVGTYYYSSGLNPVLPVTLQGEQGSVLCYTGTAHAIDLGPNSLTSANYQSDWYRIRGLRFQCGTTMTEGIFMNNWLLFVEIDHNNFYNFGNASSWMIWSNGNQNDLAVTNNTFIVNDSTLGGLNPFPRGGVNMTTTSTNSTLRLQGNEVSCITGLFGNIGCGNAIGAFATISGFGNMIQNNNFNGGYCPWIALNNNGGGNSGTRIIGNNMETVSGCAAITFTTGVDSLKVMGNFFDSNPLLAPNINTDTLANVTVSQNYITKINPGNVVVSLNNLTGQTGNVAYNNTCSTNLGVAATPCVTLHTSGANITQWNGDYAGTCTMAAGACPAYNFLVTYAVAPKCTATWNGTGTLTGLIKAANTKTTLTITSTVGTDTAVINWSCNPEAQ